MAQIPEIRNMAELLRSTLPSGMRVNGYESRFLTNPGDNYGSTMLAVTVQVADANDKTHQLYLVAKMRPMTVQFQKIFQIDSTFAKEANFYRLMVPEMIQMQCEAGYKKDEIIDVFCRCYSARVSLEPGSTKVDEDGVMLFEDLTRIGFITEDRRIGFTPATAKFVLKKLALFHALPIVLRSRKHNVFETKFDKFLYKINLGAALPDDVRQGMLDMLKRDFSKSGIREQIKQPIQSLITDYYYRQQNLIPDENNQYSSIVHNDLWVNNMMIKYDNNKNAIAVKLIDFQVIQFESLVRDIVLFLLTSVNDPSMDHNMDSYLHIYFDAFHSHLVTLQCPDIEKFTWESFEEELQRIAPREFQHIVFMLRVVLARKESVPEQSKMNANFLCKEELVEEDYFRRLKMLVDVYERKGWLKC